MDFIKKVPAGMMVVPLILGCLVNTFFPSALQIGGITTATFSSAGGSCALGILLFCMGTTLTVKDMPAVVKRGGLLLVSKFVIGAAAIVLGAQLLIDNGSALARMLNVPDSIIAATMIAIGTSLPELVTTITAIRKKQSSLSVGNIIGANIMDLTLIMPLCALIQGKAMLVERQGMLLDIPACFVISAAALIPALISGKFKRWTGYLIGGLYIVYLIIMFTSFGV